ncbi:MAG: AraC family transcriptional regulator, partial [Chitinophagaceae bacterium]
GDLYYFPEGKKPQLFLSKISKFSRDNDYVYDLAVLNKKLYLFYRSGLLICFDLASKKELYRQYSLPLAEAEKYASTSFVVPGKKQFYQLKNGSAGGIMLSYDPKSRKWTTVLKTAYWLNYLSIDKTRNIWVTCKEGMWRLNTASSQKEFIPNLKLVDGQIINTEVSTIYHDKQGGMWLGTLNRGLLYYHPDRFKFRNMGKTFFQLSNAANLSVSCFTEDKNGEILVGTKQGLFRYSPRLGTIVKHPATENLDCNALLRDRHNRIWLATNGKGLINIDPNGKLQSYKSSPETIYSILENPDGTLLLGTRGAGFGTFYPDGGTYKKREGSMKIGHSSVFQLSYVT